MLVGASGSTFRGCERRQFRLLTVARSMKMAHRYKAVLIDLNGTLFVGDTAIPGSADALSALRQQGLQVRFVTNTTKDTSINLQGLLSRLGFDIQPREVMSSLGAAKKLLKDRNLRPFLLMHPKALPEFDDTPQQDPNAVVVGLAMEAFSYDNMNSAFRVLLDDPEAPLIAIHKGRYFKDNKGGLSLGPGPYVSALEFATGRRAEVVGKPEQAFFQTVLDDMGCSAGEAVMVGDDVRDDVGGAQAAGLDGILVKTGKYRQGDETDFGVTPNAVVPNFAEAVKWILQHQRPEA